MQYLASGSFALSAPKQIAPRLSQINSNGHFRCLSGYGLGARDSSPNLVMINFN